MEGRLGTHAGVYAQITILNDSMGGFLQGSLRAGAECFSFSDLSQALGHEDHKYR